MKHTSIIHFAVSYITSILLMICISIMSLILLSILTYLFKWQAPQAMLGIIVTYILTGLAGGLFVPSLKKGDSLIRGTGYTVLLVGIALFVAEDSHVEIIASITIWLMVTGSCAIGEILRRHRRKNL